MASLSQPTLILLHAIRRAYPNTEVSGCIDQLNTIHILEPFNTTILTIDDVKPVKIDASCSVQIDYPCTGLVFHTHPSECYVNNHSRIGIPSDADIALLFKKSYATSIVVAVEGVYVMHRPLIYKNAEQILAYVLSKIKHIDRSDKDHRDLQIHRFVKSLNKTKCMHVTFIPS